MILKALEMQGFKSFPEKTTLKFGKGITAVVGPNGSGKSNISDAVRWVLGEQSSKSLRGSKMEDVIFDGTGVRKAYGFAQVTLRLDNSDRSVQSVDEDEIAVTRKYFRSGESEYKINGKNVRLKDVHELFMDTGLGRDGYSLVSQGKIADMISGKGSECREMLEEAAGISAYRYRRGDSLKKLAQSEENLVRLRDILSELEGRIGPLKIQSEKAEKFLILSEERKTLEIGLWLYNIDRLKSQLKKQEDSILIADGHYREVEQSLEALESEIEKAIEFSQSVTARIDEIRQNVSENESAAASIDSECAVLQSSVSHNEDTISRILREKDASSETAEQLEREIASDEKIVAQMRGIAESKRGQLEKIERSLDEQRRYESDLDKKSLDLSAEIAEKTRTLSDFRVSEKAAQSSIDEILSRKQQLSQASGEREAELLKLADAAEKAESALLDCAEAAVSLSNTVDGLSIKHNNKKQRAEKLKKEIGDLSFEVSHTRSKAKMLEDLEKSMEGYSGAVKKVIREQENGGLDGIHGTVSRLIATDEEYTAAIETALGAAVQNIVCSAENDAKRAIAFLKRSNAGRATFLPLTSVKGRRLDEKGLANEDGFVGLACDLVSAEKEYGEIILSLLGRTAVAEDLNFAVSIAKKHGYRFKIVTLDGQVVNAGGSMTGGSQSRNAGFLSRSAEIEKLHRALENSGKRLAEMQTEYAELDSELQKSEAEIRSAKQSLYSKQEEKIRLEGEKRLADEQYLSAKKAFDELNEEIGGSERRIGELGAALESAQSKIADLSAEIEEAQGRLSAFGEEKDELIKKGESTARSLSGLKLEIHDAEKDLAARTASMNLLKARLLSHEDKGRELEDEIEQLRRNSRDIKEKTAGLQREAKEKRLENERLKTQIVSLQSERTKSEENSVSLRSRERTLTADREKLSGERARLEERRAGMQSEYDATIGKLFDEYQLTKREAESLTGKTEDPAGSKRRLAEIKNKIRSLGSVNVGAIDEYKEVGERYRFMSEQVADVEKSKRELSRLIAELTENMSVQFREQFTKINAYFGETFSELFGGGKAELVLTDPADVLESQIDIKLQPPGKNVKRLDSLSGGEKGLSAISLLFAILKVNPAPFCIFDEVEAALDDVNVTRYAQYVRRMTESTQFILITHRRGTMEEADMLYGITMQEQGVSKLLQLNTAELASKLGITT